MPSKVHEWLKELNRHEKEADGIRDALKAEFACRDPDGTEAMLFASVNTNDVIIENHKLTRADALALAAWIVDMVKNQ